MRKVLEEKDYVRRPWKNGRGMTNEIMVWPTGEENFIWRVSQATLGESGPFSLFPGIKRWLVLLQGNPVILRHNGRVHELKLLAPYSFPGGEETFAETQGPGSDFNLMLREGKASGKISTGYSGRVKITSRFFGFFSTEEMKIDGELIKKNNFSYFEDEKGLEVSVESRHSFLVIEIEA